MNRKKIYIASPYTIGDVAVNVKRSMDAANELIKLGYAPYCPLLCHFLHMNNPQDYEVWMDVGLTWLVHCDAVLRLEGESKGADIECSAAIDHNIPVFDSIDQFRLKAHPPTPKPIFHTHRPRINYPISVDLERTGTETQPTVDVPDFKT